MTPDTGASAGSSDGPETVRVVSRDRPVPISAQLDLDEYGLVRTERPDGDGPAEVLYLRRRPPRELLDEYGLVVSSARRELWKDANGRVIEIHADRVVIDGTETDIDPDDARTYVRAGGHEPIDVPENE